MYASVLHNIQHGKIETFSQTLEKVHTQTPTKCIMTAFDLSSNFLTVDNIGKPSGHLQSRQTSPGTLWSIRQDIVMDCELD